MKSDRMMRRSWGRGCCHHLRSANYPKYLLSFIYPYLFKVITSKGDKTVIGVGVAKPAMTVCWTGIVVTYWVCWLGFWFCNWCGSVNITGWLLDASVCTDEHGTCCTCWGGGFWLWLLNWDDLYFNRKTIKFCWDFNSWRGVWFTPLLIGIPPVNCCWLLWLCLDAGESADVLVQSLGAPEWGRRLLLCLPVPFWELALPRCELEAWPQGEEVPLPGVNVGTGKESSNVIFDSSIVESSDFFRDCFITST